MSMKKTLAIVLAIACVLAMSVIVFAEGLSENEEIVNETTAEGIADEAVEAEAEAVDEEAADEATEAPADVEAAEEEVPAETENAEFDEWMAMRDPSLISEEDWQFCYVLSHVRQWYPGDSGVFENIGTETITLTVQREYKIPAEVTQEMFEAMLSDPNVSAPYDVIASDTVTIEIPAGETVSVPLDAELMAGSNPWVYGGLWIVAGTYNGISAVID